MRVTMLALLLFVFVSVPAFAQEPPLVVGEAFAVEFDHDGTHTDGYRLYVGDAVVATLPVGSLSGGVVRFEGVTLGTRGDHAISASAHNADAESRSAVVVVSAVLPAPSVPGVPRIIRITTTTDAEIAEDGSLRVVASSTRTEVIDK